MMPNGDQAQLAVEHDDMRELETPAERHEAAKPSLAGLGNLALYQIQDDLMQLLGLAEEPDLDPESKAAIDQQISAYFMAQVRKVDGIAVAVRACRSAAAEVRAERARLDAILEAWEARERRIKDNAMYAMQAHGVRVLETPKNKLRIQGNGGVEPLFVDEKREVDEFHDITVTLTICQWCDLVKAGLAAEVLTESQAVEFERRFPSFPSNERIRGALTRGNKVPGAQLLTRGQHLRVE